MAFDPDLADRIRARVGKRKGFTEKQMFGGIAFLLNGNMCCGVHQTEMIARVDPADGKMARAPHSRPFDITGRPMKGWLLVGPKGLAKDADLERWIDRAATYVGSLAPK